MLMRIVIRNELILLLLFFVIVSCEKKNLEDEWIQKALIASDNNLKIKYYTKAIKLNSKSRVDVLSRGLASFSNS